MTRPEFQSCESSKGSQTGEEEAERLHRALKAWYADTDDNFTNEDASPMQTHPEQRL
jgi:hypothetical protein